VIAHEPASTVEEVIAQLLGLDQATVIEPCRVEIDGEGDTFVLRLVPEGGDPVLAQARALLQEAAAAELSAVKSGEIGAFDRDQRVRIAAFLAKTEAARTSDARQEITPGYDGEICEDCNRPVRRGILSYWRAPDELWAKVMGEGSTAIVCPACFTARAGCEVAWVPIAVTGDDLVEPITPEEARALHAVWAGDAFDAQFLESVQPKLEAIAGESWR
jgi:hypothetical protein